MQLIINCFQIVLFIALVFGYLGHFNSQWTKDWNAENKKNSTTITKKVCDESAEKYDANPPKKGKRCPNNAMMMEQLFLAITMIVFLLSILDIVISMFKDATKNKLSVSLIYAVIFLIIVNAWIN